MNTSSNPIPGSSVSASAGRGDLSGGLCPYAEHLSALAVGADKAETSCRLSALELHLQGMKSQSEHPAFPSQHGLEGSRALTVLHSSHAELLVSTLL